MRPSFNPNFAALLEQARARAVDPLDKELINRVDMIIAQEGIISGREYSQLRRISQLPEVPAP